MNMPLRAQHGFSLLEAVIAISVILIGVVAIITLSQATLVLGAVTSDEFVAANLAREGVEAARQVRDSNWLSYDTSSTGNWNDQLHQTTDYTAVVTIKDQPLTGNYFAFRPTTFGSTCPGSGATTYDCSAVWLDAANNQYFQTARATFVPSSYTQTAYSRIVTLKPICWNAATQTETVIVSGNTCVALGQPQIGIDVISSVQYPARATTATYIIEEKMYNWRYDE